MKKYLFLLFFMFPSLCFSAPSNSISIPNTFTSNTVIQSSQVNNNFNEGQTKYNAHTHTDITSLGSVTTGTWSADAVAIGYGGTGQTTQTNAFDALSPNTTQGDISYYDGTDNVRLAAGTTGYFLQTQGSGNNPQWAQAVRYTDARTYNGSFTIDTTTTGTQTITGVGFTPVRVIFFCSINGTVGRASWGIDDGTTKMQIDDQSANVANQMGASTSYSISIDMGSSNLFQSVISSFNSDGFVINKTKTNAPSGTLTVGFLAFR